MLRTQNIKPLKFILATMKEVGLPHFLNPSLTPASIHDTLQTLWTSLRKQTG